MRPDLAEACQRPFSNGTEGDAWQRVWCDVCVHDHGMHEGSDLSGGCAVFLTALCGDWPHEVWLPEPSDGKFALPSRLTCGMFTACELCGGDPHAETRAAIVAEVSAYWLGDEQHG